MRENDSMRKLNYMRKKYAGLMLPGTSKFSPLDITALALCFGLFHGSFLQRALAAEPSAVEAGAISSTQATDVAGSATKHVPTSEELLSLRKAVDLAPNSAKAHYAYAHGLRAAGRTGQAISEYLDASKLDPTFYVVYHELALSKAKPEQLDEAIERLKLLQEHRPNDLLLCVALSELLEQRDELYAASKVLVDLIYGNHVPPQYISRVKARIHFLLNKNKDEQTMRKVQSEEPEADGAPLPLPESSLHRGLSASQLKDSKVMQNFGHPPILP